MQTRTMGIKLRCADYGFECSYMLNSEITKEAIEKLRLHFDQEHGIDYPTEAVTQMITNRGHALNTIK